MSKAEAGLKLVRWLPQIAEATADDIARFGPNAARVRALLDFLPTMSGDAQAVSRKAWHFSGPDFDEAILGIYRPRGVDIPLNRIRQSNEASSDAYDLARSIGPMTAPAELAGRAESLAMPENIAAYTSLTNPLAAGRAVDVLRPRSPENFLDVVRGLGERGAIQQPLDVLAARGFARSPEEVRDIALQLIEDGMSVDEALKTTRMLVGEGRVY